MKRILLIDNYDSFTYNLLHLVKELGHTNIEVYRNNEITLEEVEAFDKILLSPGPGIPQEAGILLPLIVRYAATKSILGICLGHQAIGEAFGAKLENLTNVYHGVQSKVNVDNSDSLFHNMPQEINVGRYHSWIISSKKIPNCLTITAQDEFGEIMAIRHKEYDVKGIQFHPESILTPRGKQIIANWLEKK